MCACHSAPAGYGGLGAAVVLGLGMSGIWPLTASKLVDDDRYDSGTTISIAFLFSYIGNSLVPT